MIIDAWAQHPTLHFFQDPMFEPLLRWTRREVPRESVPGDSISSLLRA
jgi:hypothetical protein